MTGTCEHWQSQKECFVCQHIFNLEHSTRVKNTQQSRTLNKSQEWVQFCGGREPLVLLSSRMSTSKAGHASQQTLSASMTKGLSSLDRFCPEQYEIIFRRSWNVCGNTMCLAVHVLCFTQSQTVVTCYFFDSRQMNTQSSLNHILCKYTHYP